jgi:hypothetical protein
VRLGIGARREQLGEAHSFEGAPFALADGEDDRHRLGPEPPGGKDERVGRRRVEPVCVLHQTQHRTLLGRLCEQAEHCCRGEEALRAGRGREPERARERLRL